MSTKKVQSSKRTVIRLNRAIAGMSRAFKSQAAINEAYRLLGVMYDIAIDNIDNTLPVKEGRQLTEESKKAIAAGVKVYKNKLQSLIKEDTE